MAVSSFRKVTRNLAYGLEITFRYKIESGNIKYYWAVRSDALKRTPSKYDKSTLNRMGTQQEHFPERPLGRDHRKAYQRRVGEPG